MAIFFITKLSLTYDAVEFCTVEMTLGILELPHNLELYLIKRRGHLRHQLEMSAMTIHTREDMKVDRCLLEFVCSTKQC